MEQENLLDRIIHYEDKMAVHQIADALLQILPLHRQQPVVIVCIGTDRSTGDSLGPLIGSFLHEAGLSSFDVFGTLDEPVHAVNLKDTLYEIKSRYHNPFIIGIDACLGRVASVGEIKVGKGPVKPGAGVNKKLPEVGDAFITGIVNMAGHMEFIVLQNTRLNLVMKLARKIASAIITADSVYYRRKALPHLNLDFSKRRFAK